MSRQHLRSPCRFLHIWTMGPFSVRVVRHIFEKCREQLLVESILRLVFQCGHQCFQCFLLSAHALKCYTLPVVTVCTGWLDTTHLFGIYQRVGILLHLGMGTGSQAEEIAQ